MELKVHAAFLDNDRSAVVQTYLVLKQFVHKVGLIWCDRRNKDEKRTDAAAYQTSSAIFNGYREEPRSFPRTSYER